MNLLQRPLLFCLFPMPILSLAWVLTIGQGCFQLGFSLSKKTIGAPGKVSIENSLSWYSLGGKQDW